MKNKFIEFLVLLSTSIILSYYFHKWTEQSFLLSFIEISVTMILFVIIIESTTKRYNKDENYRKKDKKSP